MEFRADATSLIEKKDWDQVESRWMTEIESDPTRVDGFLEIAKQIRKADERGRADELLELLAEALRDRGAWHERLVVLREMGRLSRKPATLKAPLEEALRKALGDRPSFSKVMAAVDFDEKDANPVEKAEKIQTWLTYDVGEYFFMAGRGAGVVIELNADLGICRVDFERDKRVSIPLGAAQKNLVPLPPGHLLREKFEDPEGLQSRVMADPGEAFARLLGSFGRPMNVADVRDSMSGIVPDARWSTWWSAARKNPRIVVSGTGAKALYAWNETETDADQAIRREFEQAPLRAKIDLAKKHGGRGDAIAEWFARKLADAALAVADADPALAWETLANLEKLPAEVSIPIDRDQLLEGPNAARVISGISDRLLRERAVRIMRERNPDWSKVLGESFFLDDDPKILSVIMELLERDAPDTANRLIDETLRHPRRHPRAFYWYCRTASEQEDLPSRAGVNLIVQMLESIGWEEFAPIRPRMKEFFDRGGLAIRILMARENEEQARKLVESLERYGGLEEYRRDLVRDAAYLAYPALREPQVEPIFATAEAVASKREEYERMKNVEIPATLKAIQTAREMGDLRENFEYKAARQRQEYLAARVAELANELSRVRVIQPSEVDASQVRIGTRVGLRNGDVHREVTILGPWESDPEHGIYSNQSEAAHALLGHRTEEIVSFMGNDYVVESIEPWK
ncbi:MAG TPA: GreA/GreB family elongation factor [Thermoanaerobaculia bacterium]|nr:GreA/GreB family elongation factor [Thermoanaerobaculia bacterium]